MIKTKRAAIYLRVSTNDQNTDLQERDLLAYAERRGWAMVKTYRDQGFSGSTSSRPALQEMMTDCRKGRIDAVLVWKFDRFARSLPHLISSLELFRNLGIDFVSSTEAIDTSTPAGELAFQIFGAVAQFERVLLTERVRAGIEHARKCGKKLGRPSIRFLTADEREEIRRARKLQSTPYRELARRFGVSVWTAHQICK